MEIKGVIKLINNEEVISDKFKKRSFVVVTAEKYPQEILIELHQDRTDLIDPYAEGQEVEVAINLNGRCWTNKEGVEKYFNTIVGWKISKVEGGEATRSNENETDDLPF